MATLESLRLVLLDQQIIDTDDVPLGRVDDVRLVCDQDGRVFVDNLCTGQRGQDGVGAALMPIRRRRSWLGSAKARNRLASP